MEEMVCSSEKDLGSLKCQKGLPDKVTVQSSNAPKMQFPGQSIQRRENSPDGRVLCTLPAEWPCGYN
jgi:hypothetical protein